MEKQIEEQIEQVSRQILGNIGFRNQVINLARKLGLSEQDGEDILLKGLAEWSAKVTLRKQELYENNEGAIFNFCKNIALNDYSKKFKTNKRTGTIVNIEAVQNWLIDETPYTDLELKERNSELWEHIDNQPGDCPRYLRHWANGYSHEAIGFEMKCSEDQAKNRTSRCRIKLRAYMDNINWGY